MESHRSSSLLTPPPILQLDVSAGNTGDMFVWMSKEHLCVLVYVVTVMHSMQAGYMDKAQKYTEKAFLQIEKLKCKYLLQLLKFISDSI